MRLFVLLCSVSGLLGSTAAFSQDTTQTTAVTTTNTNGTNTQGNAIQSINGPTSSICGRDVGEICPVTINPDVANTDTDFQPMSQVGNPVSLITGNKYQLESDYQSASSKLQFNRHYNSHNSDFNFGYGQGWMSTYSTKIYKVAEDGFDILQSSGKRLHFRNANVDINGRSVWQSVNPENGYIFKDVGKLKWVLSDGRTLSFQGSYLVRIDFPGSQHLALYYINNRLAEIKDEAGRLLLLEYYPNQTGLAEYSTSEFGEKPNHLAKLTLPDGSEIAYDYDDNNNLSRVRYSDGTTRVFHFEDEVYTNNLTGITDRTGNRFATWGYHEDGKAASSEHADGIERITIDYYPPALNDDLGSTTITNSQGALSHYTWQSIDETGQQLLLSSDGPGCNTCPAPNMRYTYTDHTQNYRLASAIDINGRGRVYDYDEKGRILSTKRTAPSQAEPVLEVRYEYEVNSMKPARTYRPSVNREGEYQQAIIYNQESLPTEITESGFAPTVASEAGRLASLYKPISRTTRLRYEAGRISEVDGPRDDVDDITRFRYDQLGRLVRMELPSGEVIAISQYDEHGRAVEIRRGQDPIVTMEYDNHGNVVRLTRLGQSVLYAFNGENKLVSVTNPNGKTSTLSYDDAQRLNRVSDDLGRSVELSLNNESQVQERKFLGVNGDLIHSLNYVYDAESRLQSVTQEHLDPSGGNALSKTLDFEYDEFGQVNGTRDTGTGDALSFVFNDLGRLLETIEPNGLSKKKAYDVHDRLIAQTDRRLNSTQYQRDDFGYVHFLISADTGITSYDFDSAGNRVQKRNANGEVTQYRWDAANRLVEQQDPDGKTTYAYDSNSGRLLETSNPSNTEQYAYTSLAQLRKHTRIIDGNEFTTEYIYTSSGKLKNKILPDGQSLRYHYYESGPNADTLRAITKESLFGLQQTTVLAEIDLDWRDGQTSYLSHNGRRNEYQHLADGKVSSVSVTDTLTLEYEFNDDGNIVGIRHNGYEQQYEYSAGQLSGANTQTGNYNYRYDVTGNRTVASATGSVDDDESMLYYNPAAKGNRLESRVDNNTGEDIVYRYNEAGSPIRIGDLRYHYNADQRPIKITRNGDVVAEYSYNSFGERIKKITYSQSQKKVTYYLYDNRTLVAEIDGDTLEYRQNIYLKNTPVAHLIGKTTYAVHTDNIGTPKLITDKNGETVWEAAHTPLGQAVIEKQDIPFNLRFPGQYADVETGTHYNYLRDYDPRTGRYLTSDPVGLEGGDNTYAYANNNLLGAIDVLGLSSQLLRLPDSMTNSSAAPYTLSMANSAVANPSSSTSDIAELGITDINQLVTDFSTVSNGCGTDDDQREFNRAVIDWSNNSYEGLLREENILSIRNSTTSNSEPHMVALEEALTNVDTSQNPWLLALPACTDFADVKARVTAVLGKLVHDDEITGIMRALGEPGPDGCDNANAQIIDLTQLHEQVLLRFQVKLATQPSAIAAEKALLLAQNALTEFLRLNPDNPCEDVDARQTFSGQIACNEYNAIFIPLNSAVENAAERLAQTLSDLFDQFEADYYPPPDSNDAGNKRRGEILLGVVGLFVPLTAGDVAIDAALIAATAGFGKIGKFFADVGDYFDLLKNGNRARVDELLAQSGEASVRADAIKMQQAYPNRPGLSGLEYADVVRIEGKLGADKLAKLDADLANSPALANAINNDAELANAWKLFDDAGMCSFDGSVEVHARRGLVPIRDLQAGLDYVLAKDELTGIVDYKLVTDVYSNIYDKQVLITTTNNATGETQTVISNEIHPIFAQPLTPSAAVSSEGHSYDGEILGGQWIDAANLSSGDRLLNADASYSTVVSVDFVHTRFRAYNLTVAEFHTYFVSAPGSSAAYWVHNACKTNPEDLARLNDDLAHPDSQDLGELLESNPDLLDQWAKLDNYPDARRDGNTLTMMHGLDESVPIAGKGPAASRAVATLGDGQVIQSSGTFTNLDAGESYLRGPIGETNAIGITKTDLGTFVIKDSDKAKYMEKVEEVYGGSLEPETRAAIWAHLNSADEFVVRSGPPGMHSEVQAMNDIYRQAREAGQQVETMNVATLYNSGRRVGENFEACTNCNPIILDGPTNTMITIVTDPIE